MKLEKAASQLEALGNPTRLQLYRTLVRAGDEGLAVGSIQDRLTIPASTLSHHLKRLVDTGLVTQERQATTLICRAHYPGMQALDRLSRRRMLRRRHLRAGRPHRERVRCIFLPCISNILEGRKL